MSPRHIAVIAVVVLAAAGIVGGAFWLGDQAGTAEHASPDRTAGNSATAAPQSTSTRAALPRSDSAHAAGPTKVAQQWLAGRYTLRASDTAPDAWIHRVADMSTPELQSTLEKKYSGGSGGITWTQFVDQRCTRTVTGLGAEQVPEAPASESSQWLRVSGTAVTTCGIRPDDPPFPARQTVTTTLQLLRQDNGTWLVGDRVLAG